MCIKYFEGATPERAADAAGYAENPLAAAAEGIFERYAAKMEAFAYGDAAKEIMDLIHAANHYIEDSEPWTLAKDPAKAGELANVIWNLLEAIRISAHLLMPLMPRTSAEALRRIGCEGEAATDDMGASCVWGQLAAGLPVEKGDALFPRLG